MPDPLGVFKALNAGLKAALERDRERADRELAKDLRLPMPAPDEPIPQAAQEAFVLGLKAQRAGDHAKAEAHFREALRIVGVTWR